jgi:methylated-DNA-[protein]-cysteine S-methyltransferase
VVLLDVILMKYTDWESPIGSLLLAGDGETLHYLSFPWEKGRIDPGRGWVRQDESFGEVKTQLGEYFSGSRRNFDLKLVAQGTSFQKSVWDALLGIPYGETRSYMDIANMIGNSRAVRAVGAANGSNPLLIVVPCHRVIGSDDSLKGFGGGLAAKAFLLNLESMVIRR